MGDDFLLVTDASNVKSIEQAMGSVENDLGVGFGDSHFVSSYLDVEFLSGYFYELNGTLIYGPKPGRVLMKTFWHIGKLKPSKRRAWLRGVALGLVRDTSFIPVLRDVIRKILDLTEGSSSRPIVDEEHRIHAKSMYHSIDLSEFLLRYDLSTLEYSKIIREIDSMTSLSTILRSGALEAIVDRDVGAWSGNLEDGR